MSGLLDSAFAQVYDRVMARTEAGGLAAWRAELLADLRGTVVELGPGTGANLPHYGGAVERLVLVEPSAPMRAQLAGPASGDPRAEVHDASARRIPLPDASADAVVATLLLCSVQDPLATLAEVRRVLRPGGRYVFVEHVAAPPGSLDRRLQGWLNPVWSALAGHCQLTRDTEATLRSAGFSFEHLQPSALPATPRFVRPAIRGIARV